VDSRSADFTLEQLRAQSPDACRSFILFHHATVYRFLAHLSRDSQAAEELTAEVFAAAWQALPSFDGRASLGTWLHRIAYTKFIDSRRGHSRSVARANAYAASGVKQEPPRDPLNGVELDEQASLLRDALAELSVVDRALVLMHYTQRLSFSEIASIVDEPEGTTKWRMSKLLKSLRAKLLEQQDGHAHTSGAAGIRS
jgi:RNA polymerase sigma-70 factor (ECF subfamily)